MTRGHWMLFLVAAILGGCGSSSLGSTSASDVEDVSTEATVTGDVTDPPSEDSSSAAECGLGDAASEAGSGGGGEGRQEALLEFLTGARQVGDTEVDPASLDANFGGVWGDLQGGVIVAVLDCSVVDKEELMRVGGGPNGLTLIEVPYSARDMATFADVLIQELDSLGVRYELPIHSTPTGQLIDINVADASALPAGFGSEVPSVVFIVTEVDGLSSPQDDG